MSCPFKQPLALPLDQRTVLLTMEMVRAVRGLDTDTLLAELDRGKWRWVWNVAVPGAEPRKLRFLAHELVAPKACRFTIVEAVDLLLGNRARLRSSEVARLLFVSRPTLMRLFEARELHFELVNRVRWVTRESLTAFFVRRMQGSGRMAGYARSHPNAPSGRFS